MHHIEVVVAIADLRFLAPLSTEVENQQPRHSFDQRSFLVRIISD